MKVKELIEELNKIEDKDREVEIYCNADGSAVEIESINPTQERIVFINEAE